MRRFVLFLLFSIGACAAALFATAGLSPLAAVAASALALACLCFVFGLVTGDYSWVDRIWSIAPVYSAWIYAAAGAWQPKPLLAALLVSVWGARLSLNFARRGGYSGTEDYRWAILRERISRPLAWQAFNALFICLFQIGVLVLITTPLGRIAAAPAAAAPAVAGPPAALDPLFAGTAILGLAFLFYETLADGQQWVFQVAKAAYRSELSRGMSPMDPSGDLSRGFRTTGLFSLSRHPSYFGELGFWWSLYLLGCNGASLLHWSLAGALALTAVFVGSTGFTERISAGKYPEYRDYQAATSAILPWFRRRGKAAQRLRGT